MIVNIIKTIDYNIYKGCEQRYPSTKRFLCKKCLLNFLLVIIPVSLLKNSYKIYELTKQNIHKRNNYKKKYYLNHKSIKLVEVLIFKLIYKHNQVYKKRSHSYLLSLEQ